MKNNYFNQFSIENDVTYLNTAYMSPSMKSVEEAGIQSVKQKSRPYQITGDDFFSGQLKLRETFAELIACDDKDRIAIIPSVSYGMSIVANNLDFTNGNEIIVVGDQFPSNVYPWRELENCGKAIIKTIEAPKVEKGRGKLWNEELISSINENTVMVSIPHIHWADGTIFDLKKVRRRTKEVGAILVIDGTQSIGALTFSNKEFEPDAVVCAGYKWLFGPYALGCAYFGPYFDDGTPIENSWYNRKRSDDFAGLVSYEDEYRAKAFKYSVGESSNFILTPMLIKSIQQINEWTPRLIENHCESISKNAIIKLRELGMFIEEDEFRSNHLFGIGIPAKYDMETLKKEFAKQKIYVSYRGNFIRIASYLFNDESDFEKLVSVFE